MKVKKCIESWKKYFDLDNGITPYTDVQHSSITCIARYEGKYIIDLILRNLIIPS